VIALLQKQRWRQIASILFEIPEDDIEATRRGVLGYARKALLNSEGNDIAGEIISQFAAPFFDSGSAGLAMACYMVLKSG
jgi:hypothetical protein